MRNKKNYLWIVGGVFAAGIALAPAWAPIILDKIDEHKARSKYEDRLFFEDEWRMRYMLRETIGRIDDA